MDDHELPPLAAGEMMCTREFLGLSKAWMAEYLAIDQRRLRRMELGQEEVIPEKVAKLLDEVYLETDEMVTQLIAKYRALAETREEIPFPVYRDDVEYRRAHHHSRFPASWHRMVAQRVAAAVPAVVPVFKEPFRVDNRPWLNKDGKSERRRAASSSAARAPRTASYADGRGSD